MAQQGGKIAIYVVLGILVLAFLFFIINTIRCYLTRPQFDDQQQGQQGQQKINNQHQMKQYG